MKIGLRLLEKFRFGDNKFLYKFCSLWGVSLWMERFIVYKAKYSKSVRTYSELNFIPKDLTLDFMKMGWDQSEVLGRRKKEGGVY